MASKKGPLSKAEVFYIEQHLKSKPLAEIAVDLDRAVHSVEKCAAKFASQQAKAEPVATSQAAPTAPQPTQIQTTSKAVRAGDQFGRNTDRGATVMTQTASEIGELSRPKSRLAPVAHCITKIRQDAPAP